MKYFAYMLLLLLLTIALAGPFLVSHSPDQLNLKISLQPSSHAHVLGTDENGRDILARLIFGARVSLGIGVAVVLLCAFVGIPLGFCAGYFGGWVDRIFLSVGDVFQAFPGILLAIALAAFLPSTVFNVIGLLAFVGWVSYARMARAQTLALKEREYVAAALSLGASRRRLFVCHFLPNMMGPLLVQAAFGMAGVILTESTLSFLGMGLPATIPSWGRMLDSGSQLLLVAPRLSLFPGLAMMISILTFNLLGDALRAKYER